jgi:hypothetical protein
MTSVKIQNNRGCGSLFHYAHFLCDCLFVEVINEIYNFHQVIRKKNLNQTIGVFSSIYEDVMQIKNIEADDLEFDSLQIHTISTWFKERYVSKEHFTKFRDFVFDRYKISKNDYDANYPEVILIERGERVELILDETLKKQNRNITNGKERREIKEIERVDEYLVNKYANRYKKIFLESMPFEQQVQYFSNAKMIICAHGAAMANIFFCKEGTQIIQGTDGRWEFFGIIVNQLNLQIQYCDNNEYNTIINSIEKTNM